MNPSTLARSNHVRPTAPKKEFRHMSLKLARFLDVTASVSIVCLAIYIATATLSLGVT
jgi:hypothetical protein